MARFFIPLNRLISGEYRRRAAVGGGGGAPLTYLLKATFQVADTGAFANGQTLGVADGVEIGSMVVVDTGDGTIEVASNKLSITQATSGNNNTVIHGAAAGYPRQIGLTTKEVGVTENSGTTNLLAGWLSSQVPSFVFLTGWQTSGGRFYNDGNPVFDVMSFAAHSDPFIFYDVIGGYDVSDVPYKAGDTKADFGLGNALFRDIAGSITLMYRSPGGAVTPLFFSSETADFSSTYTFSEIAIPDPATPAGDRSSQLLPLALDTFTDTNGVSLDAHTMDVGSGWTEHLADFDIQSNRANQIPPSTVGLATTDAGQADVFVECIVNTSSASEAAGIVLRYVDASNFWYVIINTANNTIRLHEVTAGVDTQRASAAVTININTDYRITATADDEDIVAWVNDANRISYGAAAASKTGTRYGIRAFTGANAVKFDNFAVYKRSGYTFNV